MSSGYHSLSEKEKETLRLILGGHDAKSMAGELALSVHTINERLRNARRKLGVTSSKEAARLLLEHEAAAPHSFGYKHLGEAEPGSQVAINARTASGNGSGALIGGLLAMSLVAAALFLLAPVSADEQGLATSTTQQLPAEDAVAEAAARQWLALLDTNDWDASYEGTASAFKQLNTREVWSATSQEQRAPMGAARERELLTQDITPAPPHGYRHLRFRTTFANGTTAVESIALVREDGEWKVAGILIG